MRGLPTGPRKRLAREVWGCPCPRAPAESAWSSRHGPALATHRSPRAGRGRLAAIAESPAGPVPTRDTCAAEGKENAADGALWPRRA